MRMTINDQTNIQDATLLESLTRYSEIRERINKCQDDEIIIDLSRIKFAFPLFLNLLLLLRDKNKKVRFQGKTTYLDAIYYPDAISVDALMENNAKKTYIPLLSGNPQDENESSGNVTAKIVELICRSVSIPKQVVSGVRYMLQEIIDNVGEHSLASSFYVLAQAYPKKSLVDICIADNGNGLRQSYRRAGLDVRTDLQAMKMMASAISSKDRPENESRGYGLFTSRKMTTEGLEGEFVMMSGKAVYAKIRNEEYLIDAPFMNTDGTAVAIRLRYDNEKFNMYNYLEY